MLCTLRLTSCTKSSQQERDVCLHALEMPGSTDCSSADTCHPAGQQEEQEERQRWRSARHAMAGLVMAGGALQGRPVWGRVGAGADSASMSVVSDDGRRARRAATAQQERQRIMRPDVHESQADLG